MVPDNLFIGNEVACPKEKILPVAALVESEPTLDKELLCLRMTCLVLRCVQELPATTRRKVNHFELKPAIKPGFPNDQKKVIPILLRDAI